MPDDKKKLLVRVRVPQENLQASSAQLRKGAKPIDRFIADPNKFVMAHKAKKAQKPSSKTTQSPTSAPTAAPTSTASSDKDYVLLVLDQEEFKQLDPSDVLQVEEDAKMYLPEGESAQTTSETTGLDPSQMGRPGFRSGFGDPREATDSNPGDLSLQTSAYQGTGYYAYMLDTGINDNPGLPRIDRSLGSFAGDATTTDSFHHGTHTASIAFGGEDGYATGVTVVAVKVMQNGSGDISNIIRGIYASIAAANARRDAQIAQGLTPKIPLMNISIGSANLSPELHDAFKALSDAGFIVTLAAGNDRSDACSRWPALAKGLPGFLVVQNVDRDGSLSSTSNMDRIADGCVQFSAIGTNILATVGQDQFGNSIKEVKSGTSMSAPALLGRVAQWAEYLQNRNSGVSRDEVVNAIKDAGMDAPGWYTVFEKGTGMQHRPMLPAPEVVAKRGYNQLAFDAPVGKQAFPLLMRFNEFTSTMQEQSVGFSFHLDKPASSGILRLALSSQRFIDGIEDYQFAKSQAGSEGSLDESIQLATLDLPKLSKSGDYWVRFKKQYNWADNVFENFLEVGTGTTANDATRLYSQKLPESFVTANSFGFATVGSGAPLRISSISPNGEYMFLNQVAPQTRTAAPVGEPFHKPATPSPTPQTQAPTISQHPILMKNECISFANDFTKNPKLGININRLSTKPFVIKIEQKNNKIQITINNKIVKKNVVLPSTSVLQLKRDAKTGFALQLVDKNGKTKNLYVVKKGLDSSENGVNLDFSDRIATGISKSIFDKCLKAAKTSGRLLGHTPAFAQHISSVPAIAASTFAQIGDSQKDTETSSSISHAGVIIGALAVASAGLVVKYLWDKYNKSDEGTVEKNAAEPINYCITYDPKAPVLDFSTDPAFENEVDPEDQKPSSKKLQS